MNRKICYLLNIYKNKDAKIWNVDTDFTNTLKLLKNKIYKNNNVDTKFNEVKVCKTEYKNKNGNDLFNIKIDQIDITPSRIQGGRSKSAIRQYLQLLNILNCIDFSEKSLTNNSTYKLNFEFYDIISSKLTDLIYIIIINSLKSSISFIVNYGYSLFLSLLYGKIDIKNLNEIEDDFVITKTRSKNKEKYIFFKTDECQNYLKKVSKESYNGFINAFNGSNIEFNHFIENIYLKAIMLYGNEKDMDYTEKNENFRIKNMIRLIDNSRHLPRQAIIKSRAKNNKYYTDIEYLNSENKWIDVCWPIDQSEAHIYIVFKK